MVNIGSQLASISEVTWLNLRWEEASVDAVKKDAILWFDELELVINLLADMLTLTKFLVSAGLVPDQDSHDSL